MMIELANLNKSFGEKKLFNNYSAMIEAGEFVVISGASGCGKTTLLNMIGSLEKPDSGCIRVNGLDISYSKNRRKLYREIYGFIFQNFALVEEKTVEENLSFVLPKYSSGISVASALDSVGLGGYQKQKVYKLSGGEQQRVALARLLLKKHSIVLADEPTGSLDKGNAEAVMAILQDMNRQGKTIIIATHDENIIGKSSRIIALNRKPHYPISP